MKKILFCLLIFLSSCVTTDQIKNQFKNQWSFISASTNGGFPFSNQQQTVAEPVREKKEYLAPDTVSGVILAHKYRDRQWIKTVQLNEFKIVGNDPDGKLALLTLEAYQLQKRRKYSKVLAKVEEIKKLRAEMDKNKLSMFQALEQGRSTNMMDSLALIQNADVTSGDVQSLYSFMKKHEKKSDDFEVINDGQDTELLKTALRMDGMRNIATTDVGTLQFLYDQYIKDINEYYQKGSANRATEKINDSVTILHELFYRKANPTPSYRSIIQRYHARIPTDSEYTTMGFLQRINRDLKRIPSNEFDKKKHDALNYYCSLLKRDFRKADQIMVILESEYSKTPKELLLLSLLHNDAYWYKDRALSKSPQKDSLEIVTSFSGKDRYSHETWKALLGHYKKMVSFYKMSGIEIQDYEIELATMAKTFEQGWNDVKVDYSKISDSYKIAGETIYGKDYIKDYF